MKVTGRADFLDFQMFLKRVKAEANFSQVVFEGITAMQVAQKRLSPKGKRSSIPPSIMAGRVVTEGSMWTSVSRTRNKWAVFTNEGTGTHGPKRASYPINQLRVYARGPKRGEAYEINIIHPGIRGTKWWERGATTGGEVAKSIFKRKVERMLRG